jgi:hypothetical protein
VVGVSFGIRPESDKHRDERAEREAVKRRVRARDGGQCQARDLVPAIRCSGPRDVHEIIPRSAWRAGYLVVDNCIVTCRIHHEWIHHHPDEAHALGLHGYSWEVPHA